MENQESLFEYATASMIAERCRRVESACRAIGFAADSGHELIARLVARVAGEGSLVRAMTAIADDKDVGVSYSYACRCVAELEEFGVLVRSQSKGAPTRKRGKPAMMQILTLDWDFIDKTNAIAKQFEDHLKGETRDVLPPAELVTEDCRASDEVVTNACRDGDKMVTNECREPDRTIYPPNTQNPSPPFPWESESNSRGREDISVYLGGRIHTSVAETTDTARRLFDGLVYRGTNGSTLWMVAALFDAGVLSEDDIRPCVRRAYEKAKTVEGRVGYFRTTLRNRIGVTDDQMKAILGRVSFGEESPPGPPPPPRHSGLSVGRCVPAVSRARTTVELMTELVAIGAGESYE